MRILAEVTEELDEADDKGNPILKKSEWWLLHFGLEQRYELVGDKLYPVSITIAICQNYETGQVETFLPSQLRILGKEIKE